MYTTGQLPQSRLEIGLVNEYPTMHYFGNPRHTRSMIAYMILTEYFWKFQKKLHCRNVDNMPYWVNFLKLGVLRKILHCWYKLSGSIGFRRWTWFLTTDAVQESVHRPEMVCEVCLWMMCEWHVGVSANLAALIFLAAPVNGILCFINKH